MKEGQAAKLALGARHVNACGCAYGSNPRLDRPATSWGGALASVINSRRLSEMRRASIVTEMKIRQRFSLNRGNLRDRRSSRFSVFVLLSTFVVFAVLTTAVNTPAQSSQKKEKKKAALRWDPPRVDDPLPSLSSTPSCSLATVLKQAGERAKELISHLKDFDAHEQLRYEQTDDLGMPELGISAKFDYLVDFEDQGDVPTARETRKLLAGAEGTDLSGILDRACRPSR